MTMAAPYPQPPANPLGKFLRMLAGADEAVANRCPPNEKAAMTWLGALVFGGGIYEALLLAGCAHKVFAAAGEFRPELMFGAVGIALMVVLIDVNVIMRPGWQSDGISLLRLAGIDISGSVSAKMKAGIFFAIRALFAISISQLTAICMSTLVFGPDIANIIQRNDALQNAPIVEAAKATADQDIARATETVKAEMIHVNEAAARVSVLRQTQVEPSMSDPAARQLQQELTQRLADKVKADDELQRAENFATNELGGIKGAPGNSGLAGSGFRRRAALEQVENARRRVQETGKALDAIRSKIEARQDQSAATGDQTRQRASGQLPEFEQALAAANTRLEEARNRLQALTAHRGEAIQRAVEQMPGYVRPDDGLLAQVRILKQMAKNDDTILAVITLIDLLSFAFELAAVLAKTLSPVRTRYSALIARDGYMQAVEIARGMLKELGAAEPDTTPVTEEGLSVEDLFGPAEPEPEVAPPQKRPRGRPRKNVH